MRILLLLCQGSVQDQLSLEDFQETHKQYPKIFQAPAHNLDAATEVRDNVS